MHCWDNFVVTNKHYNKIGFILSFSMKFKDIYKCVRFLYVKANSTNKHPLK